MVEKVHHFQHSQITMQTRSFARVLAVLSVASVFVADAQKCYIKATKDTDSDWPMTAYLVEHQLYPVKQTAFVCAATLIGKKALVTAAHCFDGRSKSARWYGLKFGEKDGVEYPIRTINKHPGYVKGSSYDDIAIVTLFKDAPDYTTPICLPKTNDDYADRLAYVMEWTGVSAYADAPRRLTSRRALVSTNEECRKYYPGGNSEKVSQGVIDDQLCSDLRQQQLSCNSFAGSPMILPDQHFNWFLIGLSSHREDCLGQTFPGIYTRTSRYLDWLRLVGKLDE